MKKNKKIKKIKKIKIKKELACKPTSTPINFNHKLGEVLEDVVHVLYIFML